MRVFPDLSGRLDFLVYLPFSQSLTLPLNSLTCLEYLFKKIIGLMKKDLTNG